MNITYENDDETFYILNELCSETPSIVKVLKEFTQNHALYNKDIGHIDNLLKTSESNLENITKTFYKMTGRVEE